VDKHLFVITQAVEEIEDRKALRSLGIVTGWKEDAVRDNMPQNLA
jgi:hypothetical protein